MPHHLPPSPSFLRIVLSLLALMAPARQTTIVVNKEHNSSSLSSTITFTRQAPSPRAERQDRVVADKLTDADFLINNPVPQARQITSDMSQRTQPMLAVMSDDERRSRVLQQVQLVPNGEVVFRKSGVGRGFWICR